MTGWHPGDAVCALLAGGGYAEQVVVPATQLLPIPNGLDVYTAAALPEAAATVWSNAVIAGGLGPGQLVLVHGGASGVGTHAIQVIKCFGAKVAVTAGSDYKLDKCAALGAEVLINYKHDDFVDVVRDGYRGADMILDNMGGAYLARNIDALAPDGQLIVIGMQGGVVGEIPLPRCRPSEVSSGPIVCGCVLTSERRARPRSSPT